MRKKVLKNIIFSRKNLVVSGIFRNFAGENNKHHMIINTRHNMKNNLHFPSNVASGLRCMTMMMKILARTTITAAILLVVSLFLMPQEVAGKCTPKPNGRWEDSYLPNEVTYLSSDNTLNFKVCVWDAYGNDASFYNIHGDAYVKISKDGGNNYIKVFQFGGAYYLNYAFSGGTGGSFSVKRDDNYFGKTFTCEAGSGTVMSYVEKKDGEDRRWMKITLTLNNQWRNCNIKFYSYGNWTKRSGCTDGDDVTMHEVSCEVSTPYVHRVRSILMPDTYSVSEDGTVTIPYLFSTAACNTDGETHICTSIDGRYNGTIGYKYPSSNYAPGSYSFKLSDIGKSFLSDFTIEPYHEFTHYNDGDNKNGVKYYTRSAGSERFRPLPVANITKSDFHQREKAVILHWSSSNSNYSNGKWVIYRNGTKIGEVPQSETTYTDMTFKYESYEKYKIYYVMKGWNTSTQINELCSNIVTVNTSRKVPIKDFAVESLDTMLVFTWLSDAYPANWGNRFNIYVDKETEPIYTLIPTAEQSSFCWQHRTTNKHTDRQNGMDGATHYTEEPLNGTIPHDYHIEGVINNVDKVFDTVSVKKQAIGRGTVIYLLDASKDAYAGQVKLSWHVNRQGSTQRQTYYVDRRRAETENQYTSLHIFSSDDDYLFYTDDTPLPGVCYEYRITVEETRPNGDTVRSESSDIGFSQAYGTVSGRITYGATGVAVANAAVKAELLDNYDDAEQYYAVRFTGTNGNLTWKYPSQNYAQETFINNDWTIQMWINPDVIADQRILTIGSNLFFGMSASGQAYYTQNDASSLNLFQFTANQYQHLTIAKDQDSIRFWTITHEGNVIRTSRPWTSNFVLSNADSLIIGGYKGYVDEFRLWTKALSEEEIMENYDHLLVGNEQNLETYWTFDEGLHSQFFDHSRSGTVFHNHHGKMGSNTDPTTNTPKQLALRVKTDVNGNYVLHGVPFSGEGSTYAIIPELGVHQFNPTQQLRYVSTNSQVHNGTDFDDISSFTVKGVVYYAGTNYPVEGCSLYIDGTICTKDGEDVVTNSDGGFTISVPIGDHYIQVKKDGHVFANEGRYPSAGKGTHNFNQDIQNLTFTDQTLVNFTGRVVGGNVEGSKPIGFGLSKNNIGVATLTIIPNVSEYSNYAINTTGDTVSVPSACPDTIHSTAWRGMGSQSNKIFIQTDSATGEFSALLPPLDYLIKSIYVESSELEILGSPMTLDMSNAEVESSISMEGRTYSYHSALNQIYHAPKPVFKVMQKDHPDGSFGIDRLEITDGLGTLAVDSIHYVENDTVRYKFGSPLFKTLENYVFEIEGYELFVNRDKGALTSRVPLTNTIVTIENSLSADQTVYGVDKEDSIAPGTICILASNQLSLDTAGKATYQWQGGLPNTSGDFSRTLNIYYTLNGRQYDWDCNPMMGVLLGSLPTGNNFVTGGPEKVDMILRDPPGSQSYATWETGTVTSLTTYTGYYQAADTTNDLCYTCKTNWNLDFSPSISASAGDGFSIGGGIPLVTTSLQKETTRDIFSRITNSNSIYRAVTVTQAISTSANPEYDGPDADLFIGSATNYIIGDVRRVGLYRSPTDVTKAVLDMKNDVGVGVSYGTEFIYSRHHIENTLLPELKAARNSLLVPVPSLSAASNESATNCLYVTTLSPTDPQYGETDYKMLPPTNTAGKTIIDSVSLYNSYINSWKEYLSMDEKAKVEAYNSRSSMGEKYKNYSFDAGAAISMTQTATTEHTTIGDTIQGITLNYHWESSGSFLGLLGRHITKDYVDTHDTTHTTENDTTTTTTFSYTFQDNDVNDALTVDVYEGYDQYSPIFHTRGGQTTNPYEGEVKTKYYQPGTTIMEATMQVEKPVIDVVKGTINDVPTGSAANYELRLSNQSETQTNCTYKLYLADNTNPHGAQLLIDGTPLTGDGRLIYVPYGQTQTVVKSMQLKQSDVSILDYNNIVIKLASRYQDDICDSVSVSAHFVPSSSPVTLTLGTTLMNIEYDSIHQSKLSILMSDFDRSYNNLKEFRLQYKPEGGNWTEFHRYVLNRSDSVSSICSVLPAQGDVVRYNLDMTPFTDGTYTFRIVSVSTFGLDEVTRESNEEEFVKSLARPCPLGQAQPADGILDIGDEVSVTFNMPFVNGALNKNNFAVTGVLNGSPVEHITALRTYNDTTEAIAITEANINLSGTDFSLDAWLNIQSAGTLLRHGNGKQTMKIGTDETGHLVVSFFGDSVVLTSTAVLPRDRWIFFTLNRETVNAQSGEINAVAAYDENTLNLLTNVAVPFYPGNGPLAVGCGAEAAIHEVLLWDEAHDINTALEQRSVTKNPSTRHLIGYWKMDEGEGKTVRDYARSRHMVMPEETWYINNENKAVMLDGSQYIAVPTATLATIPTDDYAMELWMQAGAQAGAAQIIQLGEVSLWLDTGGRLHLQSIENDQMVSNQVLSDGKWHHLMLNVRRTGTAAVYIDGTRSLTVSASTIGSFSSDSLIVGVRRTLVPETVTAVAHYDYDRHFAGTVDEIRLWRTTIASDLLASKRKIRLTGQEPGLSLYYPFEEKQLDEYNQIVTVGTAQDLTGHGIPATLNTLAPLTYMDDAPALREKPTQTNVAFAFTASDTKIVIDVKESPTRIEGCMLNFTVQNVRSVNGNKSQPATWSAFIHRNELAWQDEDLTVVKRENESYIVTTSLVNRSGTPQRWSLSDLPTSLTASSTSGMLNPLEREVITFVVDETAPIGKHERTIYAMGNNGVLTPITLHLTVTGDIPEWAVNPSAYPFSMDVIGQLDVFGKISENEDDMVAAFIDDECRGVAHPKYMERYDGYFVTLTISGNDIDNNKPVTFRAYDASTGITYTQVAPDSITYHSLSIIGRYNAPELFSVKDLIEQNIQLMKGWNWISLYVTADNMSPTAILDGIKEDVELIKGQTAREGFMMYSYGMWGGNMADLMNSKMYSVKMLNDRTLRVVGQRVNVNECPIELATQWNWVGYCADKRMNIGTALADMDPQSEDLILSQRGMAYYDDYEWVGSLSELQPGCGYIVFNSGQAKQFTYPSQSVAAAPARIMASSATVEPVVGSAYPYNMVLFALVTGDGKPLGEVQLLVYAGEECRAAGVTDENGRVNLLIPGEELTGLTFQVVVGDKTYDATETLNYETDAIVGTPNAPFLIDLKDITGLFGTQAGTQKTGTYDVLGRRLPEGHYLPQGVYIINGKKVVR